MTPLKKVRKINPRQYPVSSPDLEGVLEAMKLEISGISITDKIPTTSPLMNVELTRNLNTTLTL